MSSREVMLLTSYGIEFWTRIIFSKIYFGTRKISIRASFGNRVQKWSKLNPARYSVGDLIIRVRPSAVLKDSNLKKLPPQASRFLVWELYIISIMITRLVLLDCLNVLKL